MPQPISDVNGLDANIRLQDSAAQKLKTLRHTHGALDFESIETRPVFDDEVVTNLVIQEANRATYPISR